MGTPTENGSLLHYTYYSLYEEYSTPEGVLTCEKVPAHVHHACDAYLFFIILKTQQSIKVLHLYCMMYYETKRWATSIETNYGITCTGVLLYYT
jgi:hypothetical protein